MASGKGQSWGIVQLETRDIAVTSDATVLTSDAVAAEMPVLVNGYNIANCIISVDAFLDTDATVTPTFQKNTTATTREAQNATDFVTIAAGSAITCTGDSDSAAIAGYTIDLVKSGITTGLLRTSLICSDADSASASVVWILTRRNGNSADSDAISWEDVAS